MNVIKPQNNMVLCKCITPKTKTTESGFVYESNDIPLYEVISVSDSMKDDALHLEPGDVVRTCATGTLATVDEVDYVLFDIDSIMGKVQ